MSFCFLHYKFLRSCVTTCTLCITTIIISGCNPIITHFIWRSIEQLPATPDTIKSKIEHPLFQHIGLSVLWVGHASCLIQIGDKIFLTDPIFSNTAGMISKRKSEAGIHTAAIERLDFILISHLHFDHLNFGSLSLLPKASILLLPPEGARYTPDVGFKEYKELRPWESFEEDGIRITAVPVKHFNGRYGFDNAWLTQPTYVGYVIEYQGKTVFFAGDTGYDSEKFKEIGKRFSIDVALIPIAPTEPRDFMKHVHADPEEALKIFEDVHAAMMIPIHHSTFEQGLDSSLTSPRDRLIRLVANRHLEKHVLELGIGEQRVIFP